MISVAGIGPKLGINILSGIGPDELLEAIARVNRELGTTTVVITHNADIAQMADRVIHLSDGRITGVDRNIHKKTPAELAW